MLFAAEDAKLMGCCEEEEKGLMADAIQLVQPAWKRFIGVGRDETSMRRAEERM
jgi:hypothetical protein